MTPERHLTWNNFFETFIGPGVPAVHVIRHPGRSDVQLFVDLDARRIGLRTRSPAGGGDFVSPLAGVEVASRVIDGASLFEISTQLSSLYPQFYALMMDVADRIQLAGQAAPDAVAEALEDWQALLRGAAVMSPEVQMGLVGELWMLERLYQSLGAPALDTWVGPLGEPHDFRWASTEVEVKTTRSTERVHMISSLQQLQPSEGRRLCVLSLQFAPAGGSDGHALPERIAQLRRLVGPGTSRERQLNELLRRVGYRDEDAGHYRLRLAVRTRPALIPVDPACPRIVPQDVRTILGSLAERVLDVRYRINLEGMGYEDGSPEFASIVP